MSRSRSQAGRPSGRKAGASRVDRSDVASRPRVSASYSDVSPPPTATRPPSGFTSSPHRRLLGARRCDQRRAPRQRGQQARPGVRRSRRGAPPRRPAGAGPIDSVRYVERLPRPIAERRPTPPHGRLARLPPRQQPGDEGRDEQDANAGEQHPQPPVDANLTLRLFLGGVLLGLGECRAGVEERLLGRRSRLGPARSTPLEAWVSRSPRYSSLSGRSIVSHVSAAPARWRRIRWPSTSSSSQPRSRGQARASASWASSTTSPSLVTRRAATSSSIEPLVDGIVGARVRRGTRLRTGSPFGLGGDEAEQEVPQHRPLFGRQPPGRPPRPTAPPRRGCRRSSR